MLEVLMNSTLSNEQSSRVFENPLIMGRVVQYLNFLEIRRLRRTSHGILACVDHLKPDPRIEKCLVQMDTKSSLASVTFKGYPHVKHRFYEDTTNGISSQILTDFEAYFKNQKTCMTELKLNFSYCGQTEIFENAEDSESLKTLILETLNPITSEFLARFQKILEARPEPLKVQKLDLMSVRPSEVIQILPYLDAGSLKILEIRDPYLEYERKFERENYPESLKIPFDIEEIAKTEQWQNAKELEFHSFTISTPIQKMNLIQFSKMFISDVQRITSEDVAYLKENLLTTSSTLAEFTIRFKEFVGPEHLYDHIGHPSRINSVGQKFWSFRFPMSEDYLEIGLDHDAINLKRVP